MIVITDSAGGTVTFSRALVILVAIIILAISVGFYVLRGLGIYKLAKRYGVKYPILAWFPFTWFYVAGCLLGNVALFGKKSEKFALIAFIIFTVAGVFYNGLKIIYYFPMVGYYLQGGSINIVSSSSGTELIMTGFLDPYSATFRRVINILFYIARPLNIVSLFITFLVYSNFFRSFLPNHYFIATLFSIFGLFGPWAFVVRNNERINYAEYMRSRYASFYGNGGGYNGYGQNSYRNVKNDEPFEEANDGGKNKNAENDDPFGEFNDKK